MEKLNILVVGGGGREHALVWKISQSPLVEKIFCAPGNPGIGRRAECVGIKQNDIKALLNFARKKSIDLTVVGPEEPLVLGIVDTFESQGLKIFGPSEKAAELEGSKAFSKYILDKYKIPTADCIVFDDFEEARNYLRETEYPTVIKASGLAAGKGTFICQTESEANTALNKIMVEKIFGESGNKVLVEKFMRGEEASLIAITDGETLVYLPSAQDHKAIFDGDKGPNTGGMGAYAPAPIVTDKLFARIKKEVLEPTVKAMAKEGRPYRGVLYAGLMITEEGPKVVEFNCRFGDPEAQAILPLLRSDLVEIMLRVASNKPLKPNLELIDKWSMCVIMASGGYPGDYEKGKKIFGLDQDFGKNVEIFHSGTMSGENGTIISSGGRVLGITAFGDDFYSVRDKVYRAVGKITFDKAYYRRDIGAKAQRHLKNKGHY